MAIHVDSRTASPANAPERRTTMARRRWSWAPAAFLTPATAFSSPAGSDGLVRNADGAKITCASPILARAAMTGQTS